LEGLLLSGLVPISEDQCSVFLNPQLLPLTLTRETPMRYVDGFVVVVPKKNLKAYAKMAQQAGEVWKEYGAIEYLECVGEDLDIKHCLPFPKLAKTKTGETVIFAWIVYKSKAHRDKVNAKVMKDPRLNEMMKGKKMPFDPKRMAYGGFEAIVDL
jgi:uncharacterized protein YbaA (DUF1428 family)